MPPRGQPAPRVGALPRSGAEYCVRTRDATLPAAIDAMACSTIALQARATGVSASADCICQYHMHACCLPFPACQRKDTRSMPEVTRRNIGHLRSRTSCMSASGARARFRIVMHASHPALSQAALEIGILPITASAPSARIPSLSWTRRVRAMKASFAFCCRVMCPCGLITRGRAGQRPALRASAPGLLASAARTKKCRPDCSSNL